jgi:hypothetical protein
MDLLLVVLLVMLAIVVLRSNEAFDTEAPTEAPTPAVAPSQSLVQLFQRRN